MKKINVIAALCVLFVSVSGFAQIGYNVDVLPTNIGGKAEFKRIFDQELMYPENELKNKVGGKVSFDMVVNKDSTISDFRMGQHLTPALDSEAIRLFKLYQWVPALKGTQRVSTFYSVSFEFFPDKYAKLCKTRGYKTHDYLNTAKVDSSGKVYKMPEQYPMYPKGNYALQDFIKATLEYPRQAQVANIQGKVVLRFVVEPSGLMTNIAVVNSVGGGCDQEAIRILEMIKWYPGKMNNKWARVEMTLPFYFILNEDFKDNSSGEQK